MIYNFESMDATALSRLIRKNRNLLPYRKVGENKFIRWSTKKVTGEVTKAIIMGSSIPRMAESFQNVMNMTKTSAIRNARTSMTSAQNAGRLESYEAASERGIEMKKVWMATFDNRTRDTHMAMNGEMVDVDEEFSNGLMYPADPNGEPEEVYNCRCSMKVALKGIDYD